SAARNAISANAFDTSPSTLFSERPSSTAPRNALASERPTPSARSPTRFSSIDTSSSSREKLSGNRSSAIGETLHHLAEPAAVRRRRPVAAKSLERRCQLARRQPPEFFRRQPQYAEAEPHRVTPWKRHHGSPPKVARSSRAAMSAAPARPPSTAIRAKSS